MDALRPYLCKLFTIYIVFCSVFSDGKLYLQPSSEIQGFFTSDEFSVTCINPPEGGATKLVWRTPSGIISNQEGRIHVEPDNSDGQESLHLVFQGVKREDEGEYTCMGGENDSKENTKFKLIVYRSITFAGTPVSHSVQEGESSANILCRAEADPDPIVSWIFNRTSIKTGEKYTISKTGLTIRNVSKKDAGLYTCQAVLVTPTNSRIKKMNIQFNVEYGPEWTESDPEPVYASAGSVASIVCAAKSYPHPNFQWLLDGEAVEMNPDVFNVTNYYNRSVLNVILNNNSYFTDYLCRVSNRLGALEQTISLKQGDRPLRPIATKLSTEPGSLIISVREGGKNPLKITGYVVQIKHADHDDWMTARSFDFNLAEPINLTNRVSPLTNYDLRVAAKNAAGIGEFTNVIPHHQLPLLPSGTIRDQDSDGDDSNLGTTSLASGLLILSMLIGSLCNHS